MDLIPVESDKILEVNIGPVQLPGYCTGKECIITNGYIDLEKTGRLIYLDCAHEDKRPHDCTIFKAMLNHEYSEGEKKVKHRHGSKGQIMDDILEGFNATGLKEIKIPIKTNKEDDTTYPMNMKKAFLILNEMYETELEAHVIEKMAKNEFIESYVLTVKKVVPPAEQAATPIEKVKGSFGKFKTFISRHEE